MTRISGSPLGWRTVRVSMDQLCADIEGAAALIEEAAGGGDVLPDRPGDAAVLDRMHAEFVGLVEAFRGYRKVSRDEGGRNPAPLDILPPALRALAAGQSPPAGDVSQFTSRSSFDELLLRGGGLRAAVADWQLAAEQHESWHQRRRAEARDAS